MSTRRLNRSRTKEACVTAEKLGCGFIMLPRGRFALVDLDKVKSLSQYVWSLHSGGYVCRSNWDGAKSHTVYMHRQILNVPDKCDVDHRNRIRTDNRSCNLRPCGRSPNIANSKKTTRVDATSQFKGVSLCHMTGRWRARVKQNYKSIQVGKFDSEQEAARAYDRWVGEHFGEFANPNFVSP